MGSTGSIGTQALDVVAENPGLFEVVGLSASGRNRDLLLAQVERFKPEVVASVSPLELPRGVSGIWGEDSSVRLVEEVDAHIYLVALPGMAGLLPTYRAVCKGRRVALANKESLVAGGHFITSKAEKSGAEIIPVDSEHSAVFQCLMGQDRGALKRIILTASGGPFKDRPKELLSSVTPEEALSHPKWDMGPKVTVDSATMMNKGLEVVEARWLFGVGPDKIDVLVHPEAVVHSMVEFVDGSILAQLGPTDMRVPISFALGFPRRLTSGVSPLVLAGLSLTFEEPDLDKFPLLSLAYRSLERERVLPAVMSAADEVAVEAFLSRRIGFDAIYEVVVRCMEHFEGAQVSTLEDVLELQRRVVDYAKGVVRSLEGL